jgi:large subunit ribosomal protein L25
MNTVKINGTPRTGVGKKATKADRNAERIPCVIYGGSHENVHFTTSFSEVRNLIFTDAFQIAEVSVDGQTYKCLLKEVQFHPVKDNILHIDFQQLVEGRSMKVEVPLHFQGTSPGVRAGGKFIQKVRKVMVKTNPENMVHEVVADISGLELGQSLRIRDIQPIEGVEILNPPAIPIATVTVPRGLKEEAPAGAAEAPAAA